jgi:hypothetical protein
VPILKNQRHEVFAQGIAKGLSASDAFRAVTLGNPKNVDIKACQMRRQRGVEERIRELRAQNARKSEMTREELLAFYAAVIRTPADQVPAGSPVIQAYEMTESGHKVRIADKIAAGAALSRMCDWNSPERFEVSSDSLRSYLLELRTKSLFGEPAVPIERPVLPLGNGENRSDREGASE